MLRYDLLQQRDDPTLFVVYEICASDAAMEVHEGRRHNEKPDLRTALGRLEATSRKLLPFTGRYLIHHQPTDLPGLVGWPGSWRKSLKNNSNSSSSIANFSRNNNNNDTNATPARETNVSEITLLDGGMGHQLKAMGVTIKGVVGTMERFLGVAMANTDNPDLVRDAHLAYIDAGAQIITTNNYAVVPACMELREDFSGMPRLCFIGSTLVAVAVADVADNCWILLGHTLLVVVHVPSCITPLTLSILMFSFVW